MSSTSCPTGSVAAPWAPGPESHSPSPGRAPWPLVRTTYCHTVLQTPRKYTSTCPSQGSAPPVRRQDWCSAGGGGGSESGQDPLGRNPHQPRPTNANCPEPIGLQILCTLPPASASLLSSAPPAPADPAAVYILAAQMWSLDQQLPYHLGSC